MSAETLWSITVRPKDSGYAITESSDNEEAGACASLVAKALEDALDKLLDSTPAR